MIDHRLMVNQDERDYLEAAAALLRAVNDIFKVELNGKPLLECADALMGLVQAWDFLEATP